MCFCKRSHIWIYVFPPHPNKDQFHIPSSLPDLPYTFLTNTSCSFWCSLISSQFHAWSLMCSVPHCAVMLQKHTLFSHERIIFTAIVLSLVMTVVWMNLTYRLVHRGFRFSKIHCDMFISFLFHYVIQCSTVAVWMCANCTADSSSYGTSQQYAKQTVLTDWL